MAWNWKKLNAAKKRMIRRAAVALAWMELGIFLLAMVVAKLTYRVQNRVPADADGLVRDDA